MDALAVALEPHVLAARRGDRQAFARLVDASRNVVCSITLAIVRDWQASDDVAQDVFLAAWDGIARLQNPSSFLPWMRQLARNRSQDFVRAQIRQRRRQSPLGEGDASIVIDEAADASDRLIAEEDRRVLAEAMEALPEEAREIVTLYYREGRSTRQVAALLGLSEAAVKKRLERARNSLREAMFERFAEVSVKTAPGAAFTAAITTAIAVGTPGTASAAGLGAAGAAGGVAKTGAAAVAASLGGALAGLFSGVLGVRIGMHFQLRRAWDDEERRALLAVRSRATKVVFTAGTFFLVMSILAGYAPRAAAVVGIVTWVGMVVGMYQLYLRELPRILARGRAAEVAIDAAAAKRHRRREIGRWIGFTVGLVTSAIGLAFGVHSLLSHTIP